MDSKAIHPLDIHANSILATVYDHPRQVLADAILEPVQKRCILAAWASDAFAVEDRPWLRQIPGSPVPVLLSEILDALLRLDDDDGDPPPTGHTAFAHSLATIVKFDEAPSIGSRAVRDRRPARPGIRDRRLRPALTKRLPGLSAGSRAEIPHHVPVGLR